MTDPSIKAKSAEIEAGMCTQSSPVSNETWMATVRECNEAREEVRRLREAQAGREEIARIIDEHAVDTVKMHGRTNASEQAVRCCDAAFAKADAILALGVAVSPQDGGVDMPKWLREAFDGDSVPKKNIALRMAHDEIVRLRGAT